VVLFKITALSRLDTFARDRSKSPTPTNSQKSSSTWLQTRNHSPAEIPLYGRTHSYLKFQKIILKFVLKMNNSNLFFEVAQIQLCTCTHFCLLLTFLKNFCCSKILQECHKQMRVEGLSPSGWKVRQNPFFMVKKIIKSTVSVNLSKKSS